MELEPDDETRRTLEQKLKERIPLQRDEARTLLHVRWDELREKLANLVAMIDGFLADPSSVEDFGDFYEKWTQVCWKFIGVIEWLPGGLGCRNRLALVDERFRHMGAYQSILRRLRGQLYRTLPEVDTMHQVVMSFFKLLWYCAISFPEGEVQEEEQK